MADDEFDLQPITDSKDVKFDLKEEGLSPDTKVGPEQDSTFQKIKSDLISRTHSFESDHPVLSHPLNTAKSKVDGFISNRLNQLGGTESGILNPDPSQNPLLFKSVLPEFQPKSNLGQAANFAYESLIRPLASPAGIVGVLTGEPGEYQPEGSIRPEKLKLNSTAEESQLASQINKLKPIEGQTVKEVIGKTAVKNRVEVLDDGKIKLKTPPSNEQVKSDYEALKPETYDDGTAVNSEINIKLKKLFSNEKGAIGDQSGPKNLDELQNQDKQDLSDYTTGILSDAGKGNPGISIEDRTREHTNTPYKFVVYRSPDGDPIAAARVIINSDGELSVEDMAADKSRGLLYGKAVKSVGEKLKILNATNPAASDWVSEDAQNLISGSRRRGLLSDESGELRFRGKSKDEIAEIRQSLISTLANGYKSPTQLYKAYSGKITGAQFDKILGDVIDSGDIETAIKNRNVRPTGTVPSSDESLNSSVNGLGEALRGHQDVRSQTDALVSAEKSRRFLASDSVPVQSVEGAKIALSKLKGKYPVINPDQALSVIKDINFDRLMKAIHDHPDLSIFEKPRAYQALMKVMDVGEKPPLQPNEIELLKKSFGNDLGDKLSELHGGLGMVNLPNPTLESLLKIGDFTKTTRLGADIGWPLRQGKFYAGRAAWWKALGPSFKSYVSKAAAQGYLDDISRDPLYSKAREGGLDITKFGIENPTDKEELAPSNFYNKLEQKGKIGKILATPFTGSERAQTAGTDLLRMGIYKQQYTAYKNLYESALEEAGSNVAKRSEAERLNPDNPYVNRQIADEINVHTGRGKLPKLLEPANRGLNAIMYPRMISSNIRAINRTFNPVAYVSMNPIQRMEGLKRLLSFGSIVGTSLGLHQLAGSSTSDNPTDTKFLKSKFGNSIVDATGGIDPIFIAAARIATGAGTDSKGKPYNLGSFGHSTGSEIATNLAVMNRLAPIPSLAKIMIDRQEFGGKVVHKNDIPRIALQQTLEPMLIQDIYELIQDNPSLANGLLGVGEDIMGGGLSTNPPITKEERKMPKVSLQKLGPITIPVQQ